MRINQQKIIESGKRLIVLCLLLFFFSAKAQNSLGINVESVKYNFTTTFYHTTVANPFIIGFIIIFGFAFIFLELYYRQFYLSQLKIFFKTSSFQNESSIATSYTISRLGLYAILGLIISLFTTFLSLFNAHLLAYNRFSNVLLAYIFSFVINMLSYFVLKNIFTQTTTAKKVLFNYLLTWAVVSEISFMFLLPLLFVKNFILLKIFSYIWLITFLLLFLRKQVILLNIFSEARFQLLHFILYFCGVELAPVMFIFFDVKF